MRLRVPEGAGRPGGLRARGAARPRPGARRRPLPQGVLRLWPLRRRRHRRRAQPQGLRQGQRRRRPAR